jgi:hypothetical protein
MTERFSRLCAAVLPVVWVDLSESRSLMLGVEMTTKPFKFLLKIGDHFIFAPKNTIFVSYTVVKDRHLF